MKNSHFMLLVVGLILILGAFYWFQIRPAQIKTECTELVKEETQKKALAYDDDGDGKIERSDSLYLIKYRDEKYEYCLHEKGL